MKFWGRWFAFVGLYCCLNDGRIADGAVALVGRATLFVSAALLLFEEWSLLNRVVLTYEARLRAAELPVPGRLERVTHGCLPILLLGGFWLVCLGIASPWIHRVWQRDADAGPVLLLLGSVAWSLASLLVCTLALGGLTLWRFRWAARKLPAEPPAGAPAPEGQAPRAPPRPPTVVPWVVATWSAGALVVALFGLPSPDLVLAVAQALAETPRPVARAYPSGGYAPAPSTPEWARGNGGQASGDLTPSATTYGQGAAAPAERVELLLELGPDDSIAEVADVIRGLGASATRAFPGVSPTEDPELAGTWLVTAEPLPAVLLAFALIADQENVTTVELNAAVTADPLAESGQCGLESVNLPVNDPLGPPGLAAMGVGPLYYALNDRYPSRPAVVAVVDTGVDGTHDDLDAVMLPYAVADDVNGHGTAVAGLAGAVTNNARGLASHNLYGRWVRIRSYPVLAGGNADARDVAEAIVDATDDGAAVINLSFGAGGAPPRVVTEAVGYAWRHDVIVVAAAGNERGDAAQKWPANVPGVLVVGATSGATRAGFSNTTQGLGMAVSAPGEGICTTAPGGQYRRLSGTSMSAPLISGLLGTLKAVCPGLTPAHAAALLAETGTPLPGTGLGPLVQGGAALGGLGRFAECGGWM